MSLLKPYHRDASHILDWHALQVQDLGVVSMEPTRLIDQRTIKVRDKDVLQYKVQWDQFSIDSATWEDVEDMHKSIPHLFT